MFQRLPFPFPGDEFPADLGAVIQRTVLDGHEPAREVFHSLDNSWTVGDGLSDPNEPGAWVASHMHHVVARNSSVAALASLPLGYRAIRPDPGHPWVTQPSGWADGQ
jgi:hypothetical protein